MFTITIVYLNGEVFTFNDVCHIISTDNCLDFYLNDREICGKYSLNIGAVKSIVIKGV